MRPRKIAYVTTICGGDGYVPGVEALGNSLRATGTEVPLVVMATPDVPGEALSRLEAHGWQLRPVETIPAPPHAGDSHLFERFARTFTKLRGFALDEWEKIVLLDADTIVLRNVDELFDRPHFAAAPDFFMPDRFNSGVMVIEPSRSLFDAMQAALAAAPTYDGGDQGFLNSFFSNWWSMSARHRLPGAYNMHHFVFQFLASHPSLRRQFLDEIKIVHYTLQKPWQQLTLTGGARLWWEQFFGAHPEADASWKRRLHALQDWSFDSVVGVLGG